MSIHYSLRPNHLTDDPNDHMASVSPLRTAELEDVIQRMIERGSTVTRPDIISVFADFQRSLEDLLAEGSNVTLLLQTFLLVLRVYLQMMRIVTTLPDTKSILQYQPV